MKHYCQEYDIDLQKSLLWDEKLSSAFLELETQQHVAGTE
jgi:hypothetical protein